MSSLAVSCLQAGLLMGKNDRGEGLKSIVVKGLGLTYQGLGDYQSKVNTVTH
jgi:hypothetical protein